MSLRRRLSYFSPLVAVAVVLLLFIPQGKSFPRFGPVTRIVVKTASKNHPERTIDDPATVQRIVDFADNNRHHWGGMRDWGGVPVPQVTASFYNGAEFLGHFGVGPGFYACHREGEFASRKCKWAFRKSFLELVGLPDYEFD